MSVRLESISFNHDPFSARFDGLTIRRNATVLVMVPEWRSGITFSAADSLAAYALEEVQGNPLTIEAVFSRIDATLTSVEIRAVDAALEGWISSLAPLLSGSAATVLGTIALPHLWEIGVDAFASVLGVVEPRHVQFGPDGRTRGVLFNLAGVQLARRGVGVNRISWLWQWRRHAGEVWRPFARTSHTIYSVLATPSPPWQQAIGVPTQWPWTEVLDFSCRWARGARTVDEAAAGVTRAINGLGPELLEYGCPVLAFTQYAVPEGWFDCTAFLDRLRGGPGNGRYVNCTDCASIVSTFANSLGCELSQSRMGLVAPFFATNPIRAIGLTEFELPCGLPGFFYHEVAWSGTCTPDDAIYDACVQLDGDVDPTRPPHTPLLPQNLRFGDVGDRTYRDRIAAKQGRQFCVAQPLTRQRRRVY